MEKLSTYTSQTICSAPITSSVFLKTCYLGDKETLVFSNMVVMAGDGHMEKSASRYAAGKGEELTSPRNTEELFLLTAGHFGATFLQLPANGVSEAGI